MSEHPSQNDQPMPKGMPPDPFLNEEPTQSPARRRARKVTAGKKVSRRLPPFVVTLLKGFDEDEPDMNQITFPIMLIRSAEIIVEPHDDLSPESETVEVKDFTQVGLALIQRFVEIPGVIMILAHRYDVYLIISPSFDWDDVQTDLLTILSKVAGQPSDRIEVIDLTPEDCLEEEDDKPDANEDKAKKTPPK